jgi:glycine oxidase
MRPDILILGQGLAGTLFAWELERAGISFEIIDHGHDTAASAAAAGIINPITGRRLVKNWKFETLLPIARETYRGMEDVLGIPLWHDMRIRRIFADEPECAIGADPRKRADLAEFIESVDDDGWWLRSAARVDVAALLAHAKKRWAAAGKLRSETVEFHCAATHHSLVIDCRGFMGTKASMFGFVPWEFSKGELLELAIDGLDSDVILNRRMCVVPHGSGGALAGATHEPGVVDAGQSPQARILIETATRGILGNGRPFLVTGHRSGIRVVLPDKRPVAGRHPEWSQLGVINGLGGKGALWAPALARQWVKHLQGAGFDREVDVRRFAS